MFVHIFLYFFFIATEKGTCFVRLVNHSESFTFPSLFSYSLLILSSIKTFFYFTDSQKCKRWKLFRRTLSKICWRYEFIKKSSFHEYLQESSHLYSEPSTSKHLTPIPMPRSPTQPLRATSLFSNEIRRLKLQSEGDFKL